MNRFEKKYEQMIHDKIIQLCLGKKCHIFLFGSRAFAEHFKGSDFDIGIKGLSDKDFEQVEFKFKNFLEESIVPYDVDLINFNHVSESFRETALKKIITWKKD